MESICGANCNDCELLKNKKCQGCKNTNGCPFGKKCFIAKYIEIGDKKSFKLLKEQLINEFNNLNIDGMKQIEDLYPLNGSLINEEYLLPNGIKTKFLNDDEIYLGNKIECEFNDKYLKKYFGIVANMSFLLVCEFDEDGNNPEIIIYKRR